MSLIKKKYSPGDYELGTALEFVHGDDFQPLLERLLPLYEDGRLPASIDPLDFPEWIPSLILAEIETLNGQRSLSFKFFGGTPASWYGELQGDEGTENLADDKQARWIEIAEAVSSHKRPMRMFSGNNRFGQERLDIESLLVPMSEDGLSVRQILCFGKYVSDYVS